MRLPVEVHVYYIVCRGVVRNGQGRYSDIDDLKRLAVTEDPGEARMECRKVDLPYLTDYKWSRLSESDEGKKFVYFYSQTVAIWEGRRHKGGFPIDAIPASRGLCSTGIFPIRHDANGHIIRMCPSLEGLSEETRRQHPARKRRYLADLHREVREYHANRMTPGRRKSKKIRANRVNGRPR